MVRINRSLAGFLLVFFLTQCDWLTGSDQPVGDAFYRLSARMNTSLSTEFMSELRFAVVFQENSAIPESKHEDLKKGALLAMKAWGSVLPDLNPVLVDTNSSPPPKLFFVFGNFNRPNQPECCERDFDWSGISSWPNHAGTPQRKEIYYNTYGRDSYEFSAFDTVHRQDVYASYIPATYPPVFYHGNGAEPENPGHVEGRFKYNPDNNLGEVSVFSLVFHEFGHSLGIIHRPTTVNECFEWYWNRSDTIPVVENNLFPDLPEVYVGGGTYDTLTGQVANLPPVSPRGDHPLAQTHMNGYPYDCAQLADGLPNPPYAHYNNRVIFPDDIKRLPENLLSIEYPIVRDTIILTNKTKTDTVRTTDWSVALELTGMLQYQASNPYFVQDIITGAN